MAQGIGEEGFGEVAATNGGEEWEGREKMKRRWKRRSGVGLAIASLAFREKGEC